jgi:hypothetical protein
MNDRGRGINKPSNDNLKLSYFLQGKLKEIVTARDLMHSITGESFNEYGYQSLH